MSYTGASVLEPQQTPAIFIKKGIEKFGDRFDYSNLTWLPNKVGYENGKCYVTEDFNMEEDFWQLYPETMKPYTLNYLEIETADKASEYCMSGQPKDGTSTTSTFSLGETEKAVGDEFADIPPLYPI